MAVAVTRELGNAVRRLTAELAVAQESIGRLTTRSSTLADHVVPLREHGLTDGLQLHGFQVLREAFAQCSSELGQLWGLAAAVDWAASAWVGYLSATTLLCGMAV